MIKILSKLGVEEYFLELIKNIAKKTYSYITLNHKKLNDCPLRLGARMSDLSISLFSITVKVLPCSIRQEKHIQRHTVLKERHTIVPI